MAIDYTALGQRIADFRSKENLSQEELAFRCGVGNKHISNIELGKSKPSLESLVQIANFTHCFFELIHRHICFCCRYLNIKSSILNQVNQCKNCCFAS